MATNSSFTRLARSASARGRAFGVEQSRERLNLGGGWRIVRHRVSEEVPMRWVVRAEAILSKHPN